jgi:hypothetical protein
MTLLGASFRGMHVIRQSNQRWCIVIHSTNNVTVADISVQEDHALDGFVMRSIHLSRFGSTGWKAALGQCPLLFP